MTTQTQDITAQLNEIGFTLETTGPRGEVGDKDWPCIAYTVTLLYNGRAVLATPYQMGVGNVKPQSAKSIGSLTMEGQSLFEAWKRKPHANFVNKARWAEVAAAIARAQKIAPGLPEVLHSLLMDGGAHTQSLSFEDWASELGYDSDSIKAQSIYSACVEIGRQMARGIPRDVLDKARELVQDI